MDPIVFPDSMIAELSEFLSPVSKGLTEDIERMQHYVNQNAGTRPTINVYWCKAGHDTVTIDRFVHGHKKTIPCPTCKEEARSMHYMVDQQLVPLCEFYKPSDIGAFPKHQQQALRRGAPAFKRIVDEQPRRHSTGLLKKLTSKTNRV